MEQLEVLKKLLEGGHMTETEYEERRRQLIDAITSTKLCAGAPKARYNNNNNNNNRR